MPTNLDAQLIINYLAGDEKSLEILIKRYLKPIYSFVYRYVNNSQDTEDITQEVFVKAWRNLKKFNQQKSFKTWIFSIAKNTSVDHLRKKRAVTFSNFENQEGKNLLAETWADPAPNRVPHGGRHSLSFVRARRRRESRPHRHSLGQAQSPAQSRAPPRWAPRTGRKPG